MLHVVVGLSMAEQEELAPPLVFMVRELASEGMSDRDTPRRR